MYWRHPSAALLCSYSQCTDGCPFSKITITSFHQLVGFYRSGTYGRVYWGKQGLLTTRFVALKLMHETHLRSLEKRKSFLQEAKFLLVLKHPHILPLLDVGLYKGLPYLVTEYAPHGSLRDLLKDQSSQSLSLQETLLLLSQIGRALHYAHQSNIIHRDLKPENILLDANRQALLADFSTATVLTTAGNKRIEIAGTPQYMAPEQFGGHASKKSDQYALGCIAYELFTGHTPFTAPDFVSMWFRHTYTVPTPLTLLIPELPPYINKAVLKSLEKQPSKRHSDVLTFVKALQLDNKDAIQEYNILEEKDDAQFQEEWDSLFDSSTRRLPLYFLVDCSQSVVENSLRAINEGLRLVQETLMDDPRALETVYVSVIYFSNYVNQTGLVPLDQFVLPTLVEGGTKRAMGAAFRLLGDSIRQDLEFNDFRPIVFLLASGLPTDSYQPELKKLELLPHTCQPKVVALWSGDKKDASTLYEITNNVFMLPEITPEIIGDFFKWISVKLVSVSKDNNFSIGDDLALLLGEVEADEEE